MTRFAFGGKCGGLGAKGSSAALVSRDRSEARARAPRPAWLSLRKWRRVMWRRRSSRGAIGRPLETGFSARSAPSTNHRELATIPFSNPVVVGERGLVDGSAPHEHFIQVQQHVADHR